MNRIRIGILGAGGIARAHMSALKKHSDVEIVAVCDINVENAKEMALEVGAKFFSDFDDFLNVPLDAMYICLPPYAHSGQVEMVAKRGIHIFIEKPIALTIERACSMVDACEKAGIVTQVGYQNRFGVATQKLKSMIDNGTAGKPTLFDGRYACNSLHSSWWRDKSKSGGQIFEQVIHTYDICMYFLGEPDTVGGLVSNLCHQHIANYTVEDTAVGWMKFESGALATIASTNNAIPGLWQNDYSVFCEKVTVHFEGPNHAEFIYTSENPPRHERVEETLDLNDVQCEAFIRAIKKKGEETCPIREGLRSLLLVENVMESSKRGGAMLKYDADRSALA